MKTFWKFLLRKSLPSDSLKAVHMAVFGLGDSGNFCMPHTTIFSLQGLLELATLSPLESATTRRLSELQHSSQEAGQAPSRPGAAAVCDRGLGDDQHPNGYEAAWTHGYAKLWSELKLLYPLAYGHDRGLPMLCSRFVPVMRVNVLMLCACCAPGVHFLKA